MYLSVGANILKHAGDTADALVKLMALLERVVDGLEDLFVLLDMAVLELLGGLDVVFEVVGRVTPC